MNSLVADKIENVKKIEDIFTGTKGTIKKGDKVYILPACKIPGYKLKEYAKTVGATITSNYEKATVIVGTSGYRGRSEFRDTPIKSMVTNFGYYIKEFKTENLRTYIENNKVLKELSIIGHNLDEYESFVTNMRFQDSLMGDHAFAITPLGADILYNIFANKVTVISEDELVKDIAPTGILTDEMVASLKEMFKSYDESNHKIAQEILYNCDVENSIYNIYKLVRDVGVWKLMDNRNKNAKLFAERCSIYKLQDADAYKIIKLLNENYPEQLTTEVFNELLAGAAKRYMRHITDSEIFTVEVKLSDKFNKFNPEFTFKIP